MRDAVLEKRAEVLVKAKGECPVTVTLLLESGAEAVLGLGKGCRVEIGDDAHRARACLW
jgi:hypothetical protein